MHPILRRLVASAVALFCCAWMGIFAVGGVAYGVTAWSKTPLDAVLAFTGALLLGGLGVMFGCRTVQSLPQRTPTERRGFDVLPPSRP